MAYPERLIDIFWEFEIILWIIVTIVLYQVGFSLLKRYFHGPIESKPFNFGGCQFFFVFGTARLIETLRIYYIAFEHSIGYYDIALLNFQITGINFAMRITYFILSWSSIAIFFNIIEKHILKEMGFNTRYFFTICAIISGVTSILLYLNLLWVFPIMSVVVFTAMFFLICTFLIFGIRSEAKLRLSFIYCGIGLLIFVIGVLSSLPEVYYVISELIMSNEIFWHLLAPISIIFGSILLGKGFQLELFKWFKKIQHIYVMMPSGICIFDHNFKPIDRDKDLVTSALTGISGVIQEVTKSETKLKTIQQEKAMVLLEYGEYITVAMQTEEELSVLRNKLANFTAEFELFFQDVFSIWEGDTNTFLPAKILIDRIFKI